MSRSSSRVGAYSAGHRGVVAVAWVLVTAVFAVLTVTGAKSSDSAFSIAGAELTAREREVLALVVRGLSDDEIAEHFLFSTLTVKTHVNRAMREMQVPDRARLVVAGMHAGVLDPP
ncbi:helix-turn-helix transcriptional regulator [Modestobacter sp. VKM Ac-2986]|uniref:response regulator transcription factor n=1 Tax=Modestobacter sp. VKM Ac-2986 TaxID=3004140 RepID=UPI0022AB93F3|nr:helix-turn-helix transcriptional regulator [Modestobacter sp. VKM Ac-2986]MCZ2831000.1 helix-turn-helix transcriptional regulator [Modestobacter sp. VKM Ac-2986]